MGKELQPRTFKLDEGHVRKLTEIETAFAPFTDGKSATVRFLIDTMHALVFTKGTLQTIVDGLQGLLRTSSYYQADFGGIPSLAAPDAVGKGFAAEITEDDRKPRPQLVNRRTIRRDAAGMGLAWLRSSSMHVRPSFAWRQA